VTAAAPLALKFQIGARTIGSVRRTLVRVPLSLDDALGSEPLRLPNLPHGTDGLLVTSLPANQRAAIDTRGLLALERQRYTRFWTDLTIGEAAWWEQLSANTRSTLKRKAKKIGAHRVASYRTPEELLHFHGIARMVAATTYQERLLGAALPDTPEFVRSMVADAAADRVRAWILFIGELPAAYLYCPARGDTLIYEYVGHDPDYAALSPGAVLHHQAFRALFAERRFARFDFTEGEGQHKRSMATGGIDCVDLLLLRPTLSHRALIAALASFDGSVATAKTALRRWNLDALARSVRRG
jgi:CelD/BcsL family acetyltransferase involved in cellulose biosynthesis